MSVIRFFFLLVILYLLTTFQTGAVHHLSQSFIFADLPLILIISTGLFAGPTAGCLLGFAGGLMFDLSTETIMGLNIMSNTIVGYLSGMLEKNLKAEEPLALSLMLGGLTLFKYSVYGILTGLTGMGLKIAETTKIGIFPAMINFFLFLIFFRLLNSMMSYFTATR